MSEPRLIAVEEHFLVDELLAAGQRYLASPAAASSGWREAGAALEDGDRERRGRLALDLGEGRIAAMDAAGIERATSTLGFCGVIVNSHTRGEYLDAPRYEPLFAAAEACGIPIYLHPSLLPAGAVAPYLDYGLRAAMWGYAADASLHALRIILAGTFDRFPRLQMVLGHLGEHIPFSLSRLDAHHAQTRAKTTLHLQRRPSEYVRDHLVVSTSGMNHASASVRFCIDELGADRVMFAADYPFEDADEEVAAFARIPLSDDERTALAHGNAERVFGL